MLSTDAIHASLRQYDRMAPPDAGPPLGADEAAPIQAEPLSFGEAVRALNPLHHLPGVGIAYRALTGEEINPAFRVLGGALFGGPLGMVTAAVTAAIEQFQPGAHLLAAFRGEEEANPPTTMLTHAYTAYGQFGQIEVGGA